MGRAKMLRLSAKSASSEVTAIEPRIPARNTVTKPICTASRTNQRRGDKRHRRTGGEEEDRHRGAVEPEAGRPRSFSPTMKPATTMNTV
jgi:hypothetical protein